MTEIPTHNEKPTSLRAHLINFDQAEIRKSQFNDELFLFVTGEQPEKPWRAILAPVINQQTPDYLTVEVMRTRANDDQERRNKVHYQLSLPLNAISGKKGVMLLGANKSKKIDIDIDL